LGPRFEPERAHLEYLGIKDVKGNIEVIQVLICDRFLL